MTIELTDNEDKSAILDRLAPGIRVSANIIVRQRPVITLLTDVFTKGSEVCKTAANSCGSQIPMVGFPSQSILFGRLVIGKLLELIR